MTLIADNRTPIARKPGGNQARPHHATSRSPSSIGFNGAEAAAVTRKSSAATGVSITFAGLLTGAVVVLVGLAALTNEDSLLFLLFGISAASMLISVLAPIWMVRNIQVERLLPEAVVAGLPFKIVYVLRSRRRRYGSWSLLVGERAVNLDLPGGFAAPVRLSSSVQASAGGRGVRFPQAFVHFLRPGRELRLELTGNCPHRGRIELAGVRLQSRFPFGLFARSVDYDLPAELIVYPAITRLRRDPWRNPKLAGRSASRQAVERSQDEFFGVREYRFGDNLRWVHWRRSARTGTLVVREMMPVRPTQLIVLLDPWPALCSDASGQSEASRMSVRRNSGPARPPDLMAERLISAAATVLCDGLERGHRVGLVCRSAVPLVVPPAAGRPQRQRLLHQLALAHPGAQEDLYDIVTRIRWSAGWHARCLICTTQPQETHQQVLRFLSARAETAIVLTPLSEGFDTLFDLSRDTMPAEMTP